MAQGGGSRELSLAGVAAVLLALIGPVLWKSVTLEVPRQPPGTPERSTEPALQDIDARLWEDPFAAVTRGRKAAGSPSSPPAAHSQPRGASRRAGRNLAGLCEVLGQAGRYPRKVQVLGVLLSNSQYADGEERRRKVRYALQSALGVSHFVPENAAHLGYVRWPDPGSGATDESLFTYAPFELFRRTNQTKIGSDQQVLVLWLEEEWFVRRLPQGQAPLAQLGGLVEDLRTQCARHGLPRGQIDVAVIGPATSDSLRAMVKETERPGLGTAASGLRIYSSNATASELDMLDADPHWRVRDVVCPASGPRLDAGPGPNMQEELKVRGIEFVRVVATDDQLACALVHELENRRVVLDGANPSAPRVALVSEWDTYYGRMLPKAFLRAAGMEAACETDPTEPQASPQLGCRVLRFHYLRGLSELPLGTPAPKDGSDAAKDGKGAPPSEIAEGPKQLDYLRRLADRIRREDLRLRHAGQGEITAIGVLGSDVYDKISVLRALRAEFPRAVFFSTDLDARLLDARQYDWTRNLVVASSFGLELTPCLQRGVPPFRDVYQTSAFFAARLALFNAFSGTRGRDRVELCPDLALPQGVADSACSGMWWSQAALEQARPPRLFEIGRTGAVPLDITEGRCSGLCDCVNVHPANSGTALDWAGLGWSALALAIAAAGLLLVRSVRRLPRLAWDFFKGVPADGGPDLHLRSRWLFGGALVLLVAAVTLLLVRAVLDTLAGTGEPFLWLEGVSAWPSELIRFVALLLSLLFLVYAMQRVWRDDVRLSAAFHILPQAAVERLRDTLLGRFTGVLDTNGTVNIGRLWAQYRLCGQWYYALLRSSVLVVAFMLLAASLFHLFGAANVPVRGVWAFRFDRAVMFLCVILFLWLLFYVNDAIRLCDRFIFHLTHEGRLTAWPQAALAQAQADLGLGRLDEIELLRKTLDPWLDLDIIRRRTAAIGPLIYLPFIVLALLILARWPVFDHWDTPPALALVFGLSFAISCINAFLLQQTAGGAREACLNQLQDVLATVRATRPDDRVTLQQVETMLTRVRNLREGAFVPFLEQPLTRAALLPFGSAGLLQLIELFALATG